MMPPLAISKRNDSITTMHLEALKYFCDLASLRSFSKAAEANGMPQPAISRIIHKLEEHLEVQLIDRSQRPVQLTPLGQAYYEGCKRIIEQYLELESSIRQAHAQLALNVRVAAIYSIGLGDMGQYVERFTAEHPYVKVHVDYLHPDRVYEQVLDGTADFGLVSFPRRNRELAVLPWREEEMVLACPPDHPLARLPGVPPGRLDGEKYVAFARELTIRRQIDRFLRQHGAAVEVVQEFDNIENIKRGIESGAGLALLPEPRLRQEVHNGTLRAVPLEGSRLVRPLGIIHRRQPPLGSAALGFIDLLRDGDTVQRNGACNGTALGPLSGRPTAGQTTPDQSAERG
jgi:DNA-binding transcriptional LysR family regulator